MLTKPNILRLVFFIATFAGALYIPLREVLAFERPKTPPTGMRFGISGCDPYDPVRGHYLDLNTGVLLKLSPDEYRKSENLFLARRKKAFAILETGEDGIAKVTGLVPADRAPAGKTFVTVRNFWLPKGKGDLEAVVYLPFDRYYIDEKLAKPAENLLQQAVARKSAVLVVDIYADGRYAVKDLLIDGRPLREHLVPKQK